MFKPTTEQALRSVQFAARRRLNTALDVAMKTVVIRVAQGSDEFGTEVPLAISSTQAQLFTQYLSNVDRLDSARILNSGLPVVKTIRFEKGVGMSFDITEFEYSDVWELLHLCRPLFLCDEPASFEKTLGYFGRNGKGTSLAGWAKSVRIMYEKGPYQPYFQFSIGETPIFHERTLLAWLNGVEYHQDRDKAQKVKELEKALGENVARGMFVAQLSGRISAIYRLAQVIEMVLDKYEGKAVSGGAI